MSPDFASRQRGFSLLEAIVALTILAAGGMALFAALNGSVSMAQRAARAIEEDTAVANALAWMETVNPMEAAGGEAVLGEYRLRWRAEPIEPPRDTITASLRPGLYRVGLYRIRLQLSRDGRTEREFELRRVGYEQVRLPEAM